MCLATPAKIKSKHGGFAVVDFGGITKKISLGLLQHAVAGDYVLVHAGFAISLVDKKEADSIHRALDDLKKALNE
ncbi:MAG: HypC/HybG/HupF family hydrogenase formation chaperone [Elusimicrobia bacterium]|nr:HypC/HybG/HupF family hydrogenase formation chaperone [Elusimicrobiota bacterium]MBD3411580.1 HypC/HybG/HupF family hydrogenase formation chaperone [Elusimicrobiota bacterium]